MASRAVRRLQTATLLVASLGVALGLAELVARVATPPPPARVELPRDETAGARRSAENAAPLELERLGDSSRHIFVETPTGRRLRASAKLRLRHFLNGRIIDFETNALGYRNRELGPKQITRVLFLGDSITGGDYLQQDETFVAQVEALSWREGRPVETINAGVGAIGLENELAILEETGLSTAPDAVVLGFYLNDFDASAGFAVTELPGWLRGSRLAWWLLRGLEIWRVERRTLPAIGDEELLALRAEIRASHPPGPGNPLEERAAFFRYVDGAVTDWGAAWSDSLWQRMRPLFVRFRELADTHGFAPLLVVFPIRGQVEAKFVEDTPQRRAREVADSLDVPVLDLLPLLRDLDSHEGLFYDHCHYTPRGNEIVAAAIWELIRSHVDVPRGEVPQALREP